MSIAGKTSVAAIIFFLISLGAVGIFSEVTPFLENLELKYYDFLMSVVRGPVPPPPNVRIVAIDEAAIQEFGSPPWPRSLYALLIDQLNRAGARAVAFDLLFDLPSLPEQDQTLAKAIQTSEIPIILSAVVEVVETPQFKGVTRILPLEDFVQTGALIGFAFFNLDPDGVIRQGRLSAGGEPALAVQTFAAVGGQLELSGLPVIDFEGTDPEILVNYVGGSRNISTVSFYQAADPEQWLPPEYFKDAVVFVGYSLAAADVSQDTVSDHFATPFEGAGSAARMAGVEIHANLFDTLFRQRFIHRIDPASLWILLVLLGILVSLAMLRPVSIRRKFLFSSFLILIFVVSGVVLFLYNFWLLVVQPVAVLVVIVSLNTVYQYLEAEKERGQIRGILSGYVSRQVMEKVLQTPDRLRLGGEQVEATVLFADIAGFSSIAEKSNPQQVAEELNRYFTRIGDIIMQREGMINKYIGDSVMALWNVPLPNQKHASLACQAALLMEEAVEKETPHLRTRIGINTGQMVAGNLGHRQRMEYTVIGDAVNLASRLEGVNKVYGSSILLSETVRSQIGGEFLLRRVDHIRVMGKKEPVAIYELLGQEAGQNGVEIKALIASFEEILQGYDERRWEEVCRQLAEHLTRFPQDRVARTYLKRCQSFYSEPPDPQWDGVFSLERK